MGAGTTGGTRGTTAARTSGGNGIADRRTTERRSTETKASFKTTEFFAYLAAVAGVLIAAAIVAIRLRGPALPSRSGRRRCRARGCRTSRARG